MKTEGLEVLSMFVFALAVLVIAGSAIHYGGRISIARIPMQWGTDGNPTWFAPRIIGLWWLLYFTVVIGIGLFVLAHFTEGGKASTVWYVAMFFSASTTITQIWHLRAVARWAAAQ